MVVILNNQLPWDGSHLGSDPKIIISQQWRIEGSTYYGISFPPGWVYPNELGSVGDKGGIIYCMATCTKEIFPCIVEDIKSVFGLPRRGIHRITIANREYIIFYVPITLKGEVIWETPLSRLDSKHKLRSNVEFRKSVQKTIVFCDILALCNTNESQIRIRMGVGENFIPISFNENSTAISKCAEYDYSILTKTLFSKWFGEEFFMSDIVKEMVHYNDNLAVISAKIRSKVDDIVQRYSSNYIWYSGFIVERMSRHLLIAD